MTRRIVWGALASDAGLQAALGRVPIGQVITLADHALLLDPATSVPVLVPAVGQGAQILVLDGLTPAELADLAFVESALGASQQFDQGPLTGQRAHHGTQGQEPPDLGLTLIAELLSWRHQISAEALARRRGALAVVAAARLRAKNVAPTQLRRHAQPADSKVDALRHPYAQFFAVEERDTAWRRFDGTMGAPVTRAVFVSGDAVTVLPYDPLRDRVLLIEQFRAGPQARGDVQAWQLEAIAGRIDPGETPEQAARREAVEEAGLVLTELLAVAHYYPSPGAVSEFLYSFIALTDLPDGSAGVFGLAHEAEDIRGHLIPFDWLVALVASGEINNAPLILTALWLQRERGRLRGVVG